MTDATRRLAASAIAWVAAQAERVRRRSPARRALGRERARWYRDLWVAAAERMGAQLIETRGESLTFALGDRRTTVDRNYTQLDPRDRLEVAGDKPLVHRRLEAAGLPVPDHLEFGFDDLGPAMEFVARNGRSVIKPASGTGAGAGVTAHVTTASDVRRAARRAVGHDRRLLVEQQVPGLNVRALVLDGDVIDAVVREPPTIFGDGVSTVRELVDAANAERRRAGTDAAQTVLPLDLDARTTLRALGLRPDSVPERGREIPVKTVINDNALPDNVGILDRVHPTVLAAAQEATTTLGLRFAGVDLIVADPAAPFPGARDVVLEVNTVPGLFHHRHTDVVAIATTVLERLLRPDDA